MTQEELLALPFRGLLKALHIKQVDLTRRWGIPIRTVAHWSAGDRPCPTYIRRMLIDLLKKTEC